MDRTLELLVDRAAIDDTVTRYFQALDRFDADGVRSTLADEFTLDAGALVSKPAAPQPIDAFMEELVARNWGFERTLHLHPNHLVEVDGDRGRVTAGMWASHIAGPGPDELFWAYGAYEIDLARVDGDWRITRLRIDTIRHEGGEPGRVYELAAQRYAAGLGH